jgi:hypothetical protein
MFEKKEGRTFYLIIIIIGVLLLLGNFQCHCTASSLALVIAFVQDNRAIIPKPRYLITSLRDHPLGKLTML